MSNTRKLSTSSKSTKFQPKRLNSSFFPNASLEKNFDYFFLQFLLYKKNLANKKLNSLPCLSLARDGALTFPPEKGAYASLKANFGKEKFSSTQQNSQASDFKFSDEKFSGHFLFLAPSNSLSTFTLKGQKFDKKESPVAFSNKAIKFSLAPGRSSSSFSLINNSFPSENLLFQRKSGDASLENFVNSTNNVAKRRETKSLVTQAAYNSSTVLLDSHTRKAFLKKKREPFFYYWLLPFFGFLTNINPKDALTEKQKRTNFSIYPATKNVNKQNSEASDLVEFDYKSANFVNPNWEFCISSKKEKCRENKSLLQNLPTLGFFEKKNWQQNFLQFFVLPNLNYQPSSSVFVAYLSAFGRPVSLFQNLNNKTKHSLVTQAILPYKLSLFNTNQNIPKNLNDKIVLESLPQNKKRSVRVNKLPFSRYARGLRFAFSGISNKKLNPQTNYLPAYGRQCLRFANSLAPREALTGISATGKLTPNNVFCFRLPLAGDFQKLDLFRINQNIADFSERNSLAKRENNFSVGKAPLKVFWNSDFKLALKIRRFANNLTLRYSFLNRKTNLTKRGQNFSVKPNNYTQFVFNSVFSNFDNQKRAKRRHSFPEEKEELKNFNPVLKDRITAERLDPKLLKKYELNYLILNSLQNTLNTVKRSNSTQIKKELEAMRLEQNLQTINNLENLKVNLRCATNSYFAMQNKESYNCLPTADGAYASLNFLYFGYFNSTTKSSKRNKEKTFLGFNLLNSHILIKIKTPEKFVQPAQNLKKQFIKPILVNKAVYPAFNSLALQELQKKVPTLRYKNSEASEKVEATEGFTFSVGKASLLNFQNTASRFALLNSTSFARSLAPYSQNKSYNNNITYIESLKNQLKLTLTKQNFIAKRGKLRNQELSPTLRYKNGYLLRFAKTEKLVRNFLVRNKAAYSIFSERKKIKNLSSLEFAEKKKAKEAIFAFLKNQLRYSLSNPLRFNKRSSASKFSQRFARPRKLAELKAKRRSDIFSTNSLVRKSSALILKNRKFFGKKFSQRFAISSEALETKICEKRQKIAKERKLKKQKRENRRRKKRKRVYPRPAWIRSRLYNFSFASRLRETVPSEKGAYASPLKTNKTSTNSYFFPCLSLARDGALTSRVSEKGAYASLKASANKNLFFNNMKFSNFDYSPNILPAEQRKAFSIFTRSNYSSLRFATREKDLYTISRPVLGELKRVLWKSYWLRKNLNTYTTKIKKELRVLQEEQRKESLFETISLIVKYLAGFDSGVFNCLPSVGGQFNSSVGFEQRLARANANQFYSVSSPAVGRQCLSLWQSAINLAEYNRLVYERMQKMIFSIRENLSSQEEMQRHIIKQLNFAHPSFKSSTKFARAKQNSSDPNSNTENKDFWLKLGKTLTFELPQSPQAFYGNTKKNRMHWALSKTYKNFREINNNKRSFSKRKNLWSTGILKEQSKANKTKKLLYNLTKNIYSGIKFVKNPNFSVTKDLGLPRIDYIYLSKIRKTEQKLGYFGFSSLRFATKNRNKLNNKENKKYRLLFENQSFKNITKNYSLPIQTSNYLIFYKKANNLADLQNTKNINNNAPSLASERQGASRGNSLNNLQPKSSSLKVASHNLQKQYWWTFSDNNFFNFLRFEKWVSRLRGTSYSFNSVSSINKVESQSPAYRLSQARGLLVVYISSFLFHFCCLISLISISQIRGIIKFGLILFSKVTNVGNQIFNLLFSVCQFFDGKFAKTSTNQLTTKSTNCLPTAGSAFFCLWQARRLAPPKFSYEASDSSLLNKVGKRMTKTRETDYKQISEASESSFQNLTTSVETKKIKNSEASDFFGNLFSTKNSEASEFRRFAKKIYYTVYLEYLAQRRQKNGINPKNVNIFSKKNLAKGNNLTKQSINVSQKSELFNSFSSEKGLYVASPLLSEISASPLLQLLKLISFNSQKGYNSARFIYKISNRVLEQILGTVTKTTAFFSRPGEFIGDWLAYLFLVEWSADLKTTIPDQIFQSYYLTINKLARLTYSASALNLVLRFALSSSNLAVGKGSASPVRSALIGSVEKESLIYNSNCLSTAGASLNFYNLNNFSSILFSFAFSKILQRRISVLFEDILEKFFQPDTDLLVRQRKSTIFWDIWGDYLVLVAEDSSINLSELTSLKEEQIKLLEILLSNSALYSAQKTNNMFITNLTQKLSNFRMSRLPSAGGAFHSTQDSSLRFAKKGASPKLQRSVGLRYSQNLINDQKLSNIVLTKEEKLKDFWGANQFLSYQSVVFSDLFIDLHPPKSFSNFNSIKYSDSLQHPIGSMVCQIYSGIFTRQISKNLLIVGAQGMEKSLLIQALAGETEFPLITDNAYRYIMVQQGVAVGIKLLRDVFDALALHTPCLFLLEDIHAIGERRPFLISDDQIHGADLLKNEFAKTGLDERNQIIYQLSKHVVSHFKKPYKGDFSLTIPTNQFCFEYLGNNKKGSIYQKPASIHLNTKQNLLNSSFISYVKNMKKQQSQNSNNFEKFITNNNDQKTKNSIFASYLQVPSNQLLAPPATSPFSVLVLKESRDTKNSAVVPVKEMPWSGLPGEQYSLMNKASYSVRVKVALLADMAISNLSVKLDMITDLLVIIDSVKGNRGFAVFATTHVPSILDPALRRPGRLDETILVPKSSVNMLCRWEVFKSQFSLYNVGTQNSGFSRSITIDFSRLVFNTNQNLVKQNFVQNKLNLFAQFNSTSFIQRFALKIERKQKLHKSFPIASPYASPFSSKNISKRSLKPKISLLLTEKSNLSYASPFISLARKNPNSTVNNKSPAFDKQCLRFTKNLVSHSYFVVSEKLISSLFNKRANRRDNMHRLSQARGNNKNNNLHDSTALALGVLELNGPHSHVDSSLYLPTLRYSLKNNNSIYPVLYAPPKLFKDYFVNFMAGKIGEMFLSTAYYNTNSFFNISPQKNLITQSSYGIDKTWRHISDFATQLIQKRYLYNQRLFSLSNIFFTNNSNFKELPGPPNSNVLLPARRSLASQEAAFNYQRNFYSQISRSSNNLNIHEKIQLHQQQRLVKRLYGYSVQGPSAEGRQFFFLKKQENNNTGTSFANAPLVLGKHELIMEKPSSSTWFYQKKILLRHKNYLTNQWWNAQLPEHNAETTFLSDIDWRYSFVDPEHSDKTAKRRSGVNKKQNVQKSKTQDLFIDFPDSVQYYNPRNRRWVLTKKEQRKRLPTADQNNNTQQITNFVNIFDFSEFSQEIYSHFLFDAYVKAYNILNQNREILDYFASKKLTSDCVTSDLTDKLDISFE